jgi:CBS domain-containing protein
MKQQCHISMIYLTWARLEDLRKQVGFRLEKIDVTLRPDLLTAKGIRSVPVVEAGARLLFGLLTTKELAEAVAEAQRAGV